jgi:hypothetical protein
MLNPIDFIFRSSVDCCLLPLPLPVLFIATALIDEATDELCLEGTDGAAEDGRGAEVVCVI